MKDDSGRLSGYGFHGDRRMKRQRTRQNALDVELVCDVCGRRNAKQASNWKLLCLECRQAEELEDSDDDWQ